MSDERKKSIHEESSRKKAAVLGAEKKKKLVPYTVLAICVLTAFAGVVIFGGIASTFQDRKTEGGATIAGKGTGQAEVVIHPVSLFDDGKARHFQFHTDNGITVKYFVLKSADGVVRAAFDACDVCWPSGKGYYQDQDKMVCRNCGKRFASVKINEVKGGCNPAPLTRRIEGGNLVIEVPDILKGMSYFDFKGRGIS